MNNYTFSPEIILASGSPRRREILSAMGLKYRVIPSDADESLPDGLAPDVIVETLAKRKAASVSASISQDSPIIIAADTIVWLNGRALGKPVDRDDAIAMLTSLSGKTHEVYTGLSISKGASSCVVHEITRVTFAELTGRMITRYVDAEAPYDKAGAYGIQGGAMIFVDKIDGDYYNVMGFPAARAAKILRQNFGVDI